MLFSVFFQILVEWFVLSSLYLFKAAYWFASLVSHSLLSLESSYLWDSTKSARATLLHFPVGAGKKLNGAFVSYVIHFLAISQVSLSLDWKLFGEP